LRQKTDIHRDRDIDINRDQRFLCRSTSDTWELHGGCGRKSCDDPTVPDRCSSELPAHSTHIHAHTFTQYTHKTHTHTKHAHTHLYTIHTHTYTHTHLHTHTHLYTIHTHTHFHTHTFTQYTHTHNCQTAGTRV